MNNKSYLQILLHNLAEFEAAELVVVVVGEVAVVVVVVVVVGVVVDALIKSVFIIILFA